MNLPDIDLELEARKTKAEAALDELRVPLPRQAEALRYILGLLCRIPEPRNQYATSGNMHLMLGRPGTGKSTVIDMVAKRALSEILIVRLPPHQLATPSGLMEHTLEALNERFPNEGRLVDKQSRVMEAIESKQKKVLIFDEIQAFLDKSRHSHVNRNSAEFLRSFLDRIKRPTVLVGHLEAIRVFANERDQQVERRVRGVIPLGPFKLDSVDDRRDFSCFVLACEQCLDFPVPSNLWQPENLVFIHQETKGCVSLIVRLIRQAAVTAIGRSLPCISREVLEEAASMMRLDAYRDDM